MRFKEKLRWILVGTVILLTVLMYHSDIYRTDLYGQIRMLAMGIIGCLILLSSWKKARCNSMFMKVVLLSIAIGFEFLLFYAFSLRVSWDDLIQLVLVVFFLFIGLNTQTDIKVLTFVCTVYCLATLIVGAMSIQTYLGGYDLAGELGLIEGKNQLGAIVALGGGTSFFLSQHSNRKLRIFYYLLAFLTFGLLLVVRCRTALVGYVFFAAVYVWRFWTKRSKTYFFVILVLLMAIFYEEVWEIFNSAILENKDTEDLNALSTGRFERNVQGFNYLFLHLFDGELFESSGIALIHNYILLRLVRYGLWGISFLVFYLFFLFKIVKDVLQRVNGIENIGVYLLIIPFFCSLLEPSAPFGPGTVYMFPFLLFGMSINGRQEKKVILTN